MHPIFLIKTRVLACMCQILIPPRLVALKGIPQPFLGAQVSSCKGTAWRQLAQLACPIVSLIETKVVLLVP